MNNHNAALPPPLRICRVITVPFGLETYLRDQLQFLTERGVELTLISNPGPQLDAVSRKVGAKAIGIPMKRRPDPFADLISLFRLTNVLRRNKFDVIHSTTPKAGLLTALAGRLVGAPIVIHTFTGQPWVELSGLRRKISRECDRITAKLMTRCYADSPSQRAFLISEGLVSAEKIAVVGQGSIAGVNLERFSSDAWGGNVAVQTRAELKIDQDATVIVFVGRVTKDKGICELLESFEAICAKSTNVYLVVVGPFEPERDPLPVSIMDRLKKNSRIVILGYTSTPEKYVGASDLICLPSYREGFGGVIVEAAAMGVPSVVTRITGLIDTVVEGQTGLMVPPKDTDALTAALQTMLAKKTFRLSMGAAARERVLRDFDSRKINEAVLAEYDELVANKVD